MKKYIIGFVVIVALGGSFFILHRSVLTKNTNTYGTALGNAFYIGSFSTLVNEQSSGGMETNCLTFQPMIVAALEDMQKHMTPRATALGYGTSWNAFSVDQDTLTLLCNKTVTLNLSDSQGNFLILEKVPFERTTSPTDQGGDIGTLITIYAALVKKGDSAPSQPDEFGRIFIADRLLNRTASQ